MEEGKSRAKAAPLLFSCRLTLFIVCLLGTLNFMLQRLNINFAVVCMVKTPHRNVTNSSEFSLTGGSDSFMENLLENNGTHSFKPGEIVDLDELTCGEDPLAPSGASHHFGENGEFEWSKETQGAILGSFYYGYIFTQVLGGWLSDKFGGKTSFITSIIFFSILSMLNPIAARLGPQFLFGVRVLMGLSHGASMPSISVLAARWSGHTERSILLGIAFAGFSISMAIVFPFSALVCQSLGWDWIFYLTGAFGVAWCIVAWFFIYDWPEQHPRISPEELKYLQENRTVSYGSRQKKLIVPWRKILFSIPINAIHFCHLCGCFGFFIVVTYLPTFLKEVIKMNLTRNGLLSSLPYVGMLFLHFFVGATFDVIRKRNLVSVTVLRKIFNSIGLLGQGFCLLFVGFLQCENVLLGMIAISIGQSLIEFAMMGGYLFSIFELAPRFAGILTGATGVFGIIAGFIVPTFVGWMTPNGTREEWLLVFYTGAGVNFLGGVVYVIFGSSELQPWANVNDSIHGLNGGVQEGGTELEAVGKLLPKDLKISKGYINGKDSTKNGALGEEEEASDVKLIS